VIIKHNKQLTYQQHSVE